MNKLLLALIILGAGIACRIDTPEDRRDLAQLDQQQRQAVVASWGDEVKR